MLPEPLARFLRRVAMRKYPDGALWLSDDGPEGQVDVRFRDVRAAVPKPTARPPAAFARFPQALAAMAPSGRPPRGVVAGHVDGDTLDALLWFEWGGAMASVPVRLKGVLAPELGTPAGDAMARFLTSVAPVGMPLVLQPTVTRTGRLKRTRDRYEAVVWIERDGEALKLNAILIAHLATVRATLKGAE